MWSLNMSTTLWIGDHAFNVTSKPYYYVLNDVLKRHVGIQLQLWAVKACVMRILTCIVADFTTSQ